MYLKPVDQMTKNELSGIYGKLKEIKSWLAELEARVKHDLMGGNSVPGYKMVFKGSSPRAWADERAAYDYFYDRLGDEVLDTKLKSPTQLQKEFKLPDDIINEFISPVERRLSVVDESDKRLSFDEELRLKEEIKTGV